jgi:hypothetical protein
MGSLVSKTMLVNIGIEYVVLNTNCTCGFYHHQFMRIELTPKTQKQMGGGEQIPSLDSAGVALYAHDLHFWELRGQSPGSAAWFWFLGLLVLFELIFVRTRLIR